MTEHVDLVLEELAEIKNKPVSTPMTRLTVAIVNCILEEAKNK